MFTGMIKEIGRLRGLVPAGGVVRVDIDGPQTARAASLGDSIAVDGICLTVTAVRGRSFSAEAATETRRLTTLRDWRPGRRLHLEPALRAGDPLDGHLVQGHVDGVGRVVKVARAGRDLLVTVGLDRKMARYLTPKGSVAVDGVSLTVDQGPHTDRFTVNFIPHTLAWTHFDGIRSGRRVNLEMDVLVKAARAGGFADLPAVDAAPAPDAGTPLTLERLLGAGFRRRGTKGST
ncbi:MAG: riboflavin synthase [bacterium]|nr:riboflavin synthase [bacterium]